MGVVIAFPNCRPLTKLEMRERLRALYSTRPTGTRSTRIHPISR